MKRAWKVLLVAALLAILGSFGQVLSQGKSSVPEARKGSQVQKQEKSSKQHTVRDRDQNGICDVCKRPTASGQKNSSGKKAEKGKHWGPGDGSGNRSDRPKDGSGYGTKSGQRTGPIIQTLKDKCG